MIDDKFLIEQGRFRFDVVALAGNVMKVQIEMPLPESMQDLLEQQFAEQRGVELQAAEGYELCVRRLDGSLLTYTNVRVISRRETDEPLEPNATMEVDGEQIAVRIDGPGINPDEKGLVLK